MTDAVSTGLSGSAKGACLAAVAGLAFSFYGLLYRYLGEAGVWHIIFYRTLGIVPLVVLALYLVHGRNTWSVALADWRVGLLGAVPLAAAQILINMAFAETTVASVLFVTALVPFGTALCARVFLREGIEKRVVAGMAVALVGVVFVGGSGIIEGRAWGLSLALAAMAAIVGFNLVLRANKNVEMLPSVAYSTVMTACVALGMLVVTDTAIAISLEDFALTQLMGAGCLGAGMVLFTLATRLRSVGELSLLTQTEVVLTPFWVWLGVGEEPTMTTLIGGALIVLALIFAVMPGLGPKRPVSPVL